MVQSFQLATSNALWAIYFGDLEGAEGAIARAEAIGPGFGGTTAAQQSRDMRFPHPCVTRQGAHVVAGQRVAWLNRRDVIRVAPCDSRHTRA